MTNKKRRGATPATIKLIKHDIAFVMHEYTHDPAVTDFGQEAARALNISPERVFKTLLVEADGYLVVGVVPVVGKLDLKAIATAAGARKAIMADARLAERKTGYVIGGISPIGQRTTLSTFIDESAQNHDTIFISGGRRGLDLELTTTDLVRACDAKIARIARTT